MSHNARFRHRCQSKTLKLQARSVIFGHDLVSYDVSEFSLRSVSGGRRNIPFQDLTVVVDWSDEGTYRSVFAYLLCRRIPT